MGSISSQELKGELNYLTYDARVPLNDVSFHQCPLRVTGPMSVSYFWSDSGLKILKIHGRRVKKKGFNVQIVKCNEWPQTNGVVNLKLGHQI